jgi:hypothetical protein
VNVAEAFEIPAFSQFNDATAAQATPRHAAAMIYVRNELRYATQISKIGSSDLYPAKMDEYARWWMLNGE